MRKFARFFIVVFFGVMVFVVSCKPANDNGTLHVEVVKNGEAYQLLVDGAPYRIKGAGLEFGNIASLARAGANSFRTWRTNNGKQSAKEVLDEAKGHGLTVTMCLELKRERHGMDYSNAKAVAEQKEDLRQQVLAIKDHPALLAWAIGNEMNLDYSNMAVWNAVNDIAKMIKEIDGNHPTTTPLAGIKKADIDYIKVNCPDLDFISIQMYGDIINLQKRITDAGWINRPYVITEWGATGAWEVPKTSWGASVEQSSSEKAASIKERYEKAISQDLNNNLGYYIFLWEQKQECTSTWYGLFSEDNLSTEPVDYITEIWTGKRPPNSAPRIISGLLNGKEKGADIYLTAGKSYSANVEASDIDGDLLTFHSEVVPESTNRKSGGDLEERPQAIEDAVSTVNSKGITFNAPIKSGPYRLFVYVYDGKGAMGTINFPFFVK